MIDASFDAAQWADLLWRDGSAPEPTLTVSEWADAHRILPDPSAEPGQWRGRNVFVFGTGTSAHDIAQELHGNGAHVTMVQRSPTLVVNVEPSAQLYDGIYYGDGPTLADRDLINTSFPLPVMKHAHTLLTAKARALKAEGTTIRIYPMRAPAYSVPVWTGKGSHGGGDDVMLAELFSPTKTADKYQRASDQRGGAASILTGIAANHSFRTGETVQIAALVPGLKSPDYPAMPNHTDPVPMLPKG